MEMTNNPSSSNVSRYSFLDDDSSSRKGKKKKNVITSLSQKLQKKITKGLVKNIIEANNSTRLITSTASNNSSNNNYFSTRSSNVVNTYETARSRRLREIQQKREKEEERERTLKRERKEPLLLPPVPPRYSSHNHNQTPVKLKPTPKIPPKDNIPTKPSVPPKDNIPTKPNDTSKNKVKRHIPVPLRGSSSNVNIKLLNKEFFENFTLSRSLPNKGKNKELKIKRSSSDITPSSSNSNSINNIKPSTSIGQSELSLLASSDYDINNSSTDFSLSSDSSSDSSSDLNESKELDEITKTTTTTNNNTVEVSRESTIKNNFDDSKEKEYNTEIKDKNKDKLKIEDKRMVNDFSSEKTLNGIENLEKEIKEDDLSIKNNNNDEFDVYNFDNSTSTFSNKIHSAKSQKINEIFKSDTKKYMDQQLSDLCLNYYKDFYYDHISSGSESEEKDLLKNNNNNLEKGKTEEKIQESEDTIKENDNGSEELNESDNFDDSEFDESSESIETLSENENDNENDDNDSENNENDNDDGNDNDNDNEIEHEDENENENINSITKDKSVETETEVKPVEEENTINKSSNDNNIQYSFLDDDYIHPFNEHSYIIKSNSSSSYFVSNKVRKNNKSNSNTLSTGSINEIKEKSDFSKINKRYTVSAMDSKHISPKIITCPSDDPSKPVTHLVNISGVTIQTNDLAHLFWVPSYLHPELHPQEFKKWIDNDPNDHFGRRLSIRRTKSFAESARVITPDSTSENGDPVVDQVQINRNKTFSYYQNRNNNSAGSIYLKRSKNIRLKKSSSRGSGNNEEFSFYNPEEDIHNGMNQKANATIQNNESQETTVTAVSKTPSSSSSSSSTASSTSSSISTSSTPSPSLSSLSSSKPTLTLGITAKPINTKPVFSSSLHNSTSIPDSSPEISDIDNDNDKGSENKDPNIKNKIKHDPNSLLDTDYADMENPPLVGMPDAIYAYKENEIPPQKSGWSLWWSSFGKDDKKESEAKKSKKSNANAATTNNKSFLPFFKSSPKSSSTNLSDKNNNYHQGKGITEAYLLDGPLEFKPLTRPTEDAIYTLSHMKLATTYRPMLQQVHINNLMQRYIILYRDAAIKIPFKTKRPPKKRRNPTKQQQMALAKVNNRTASPAVKAKAKPKPKPKPRLPPPGGPLIKDFTPSKKVGVTSPSTITTDVNNKVKRKSFTMDYNDSKLDELLEKGIEFDHQNPKHKSKGNKDGKSSKKQSMYKHLNHSISTEHFGYNNKYNKATISLDWSASNKRNDDLESKVKRNRLSNSHQYNYYSSSSSNDSDSDSDSDDDDVPLGMLRTRRPSLSSIMTV